MKLKIPFTIIFILITITSEAQIISCTSDSIRGNVKQAVVVFSGIDSNKIDISLMDILSFGEYSPMTQLYQKAITLGKKYIYNFNTHGQITSKTEEKKLNEYTYDSHNNIKNETTYHLSKSGKSKLRLQDSVQYTYKGGLLISIEKYVQTIKNPKHVRHRTLRESFTYEDQWLQKNIKNYYRRTELDTPYKTEKNIYSKNSLTGILTTEIFSNNKLLKTQKNSIKKDLSVLQRNYHANSRLDYYSIKNYRKGQLIKHSIFKKDSILTYTKHFNLSSKKPIPSPIYYHKSGYNEFISKLTIIGNLWTYKYYKNKKMTFTKTVLRDTKGNVTETKYLNKDDQIVYQYNIKYLYY